MSKKYTTSVKTEKPVVEATKEEKVVEEVKDEEVPKTLTKHMADGITYQHPYFYKCTYCKKRLNREQMLNGHCEDPVDPAAPLNVAGPVE